jgi:voltage-gated potassium channel Kch
LAAFIPIDLRSLRALRLLRILKILRVLIPAYREFKELNQGRSFRQKVHALVWPSAYGGQLHEFFDTFIMVWVVVSVTAVVLESVHTIHYVLNIEFVIFDIVAVGVFTMEYLLRVYSVVESEGHRHPLMGRLKYVKSGNAIIDFLAVVPFFLEALLHHLFDLRFLRIFRLLRLLKLTKYTGATTTLFTVIKREWPVMAGAAFILVLLVVLTASLGYLFEHEAQPDKFENIPQSIYWAVITLASVGYGDISPVTPLGRGMTVILAMIGIGIFAIPAALLSSAFSDQLRIEREKLSSELYNMMADGIISPEEQEIIDREAKRLHVSEDEVKRLIERARRERERGNDHTGLPINKLVERPEVAIERYREMLGQMRQIALLVDAQAMDRLIDDPGRTTQLERSIWKVLSKEASPS